ncbi:MAG: septum formation protein Maf [Bacteroidetes bacterium 4484_249]|nr:MAG: septum formation protein Maf [Bacteroidetes bacterium 4484_249]
MLNEFLNKYKIILASQSPRRQQLLKELGLNFDVKPVDIEESYPANLRKRDIAIYLSELKAKSFNLDELCNNCLIITADTIVLQDEQILPKPKDYDDAVRILQTLSGNVHEVITGVSFRTKNKLKSFQSVTKVYFKNLTTKEINHYIEHYKPYDKAGAYGIQEWIGYIGIEKIEGSYFNVVGLPVQKLYIELMEFVNLQNNYI